MHLSLVATARKPLIYFLDGPQGSPEIPGGFPGGTLGWSLVGPSGDPW